MALPHREEIRRELCGNDARLVMLEHDEAIAVRILPNVEVSRIAPIRLHVIVNDSIGAAQPLGLENHEVPLFAAQLKPAHIPARPGISHDMRAIDRHGGVKARLLVAGLWRDDEPLVIPVVQVL